MGSAEQRMEYAIIKTIIEDALDYGYMVTHHNGEYATAMVSANQHYSRDRIEDDPEPLTKERATNIILKELHSTDEERLIFHDTTGQSLGFVLLVYGNDGWDVIADHTDSPEMDELLAGAFELADSYAFHVPQNL
jgi:hypothetical protein